jgi:cellobiose-specific phosphotransferase system component IIC
MAAMSAMLERKLTPARCAMDQNQIHAIQAMMAILPIFILIGSIIVIIPYWMIFKKAGFPAWLGILMVVPLVNLALLYVLAFSPWKTMLATQTGYPAPAYPPQS